MIKHLLFIPCERLRSMLDHGPLDDRPPVVAHQEVEFADGKWCDTGWGPYFTPGGTGLPWRNHESALALIWDGTPQPMGIWPLVASWPDKALPNVWMHPTYTAGEAVQIATLSERLGMGHFVVVESPDGQ